MSSAGAGAGGRRVTVRSISCRGVKAFVPFQKPPLYVAVSLAGRREKTNADPDGGENPDWDGAVFAFDLDGGGGREGGVGGDGMLQFEVKAQVPLLGNKLVGKVSMPRDDLAGQGMAPRHVSYQVCAPDGKANGKLRFTYTITAGGAYQQPQPQLPPATNGARPEQDPTSCCAPPPPPPPPTSSGAPYPAPAMASYPPLPSLSAPAPAPLYPPPPSSYPPPPPPPPPPLALDSHFPAQNFPPNSSYPPPPPPPSSTYPPPPAHPSQYISSYPPPPPPPSNYYPPAPAPAGYPPPASTMNPEFPAPNFPSPTSTYPPPPPESGLQYPPLPRSAPCSDCSVDRALPYMLPPLHDAAAAYPPLSAVPCYPPAATWQPGEAAEVPYSYYPQPGSRYL